MSGLARCWQGTNRGVHLWHGAFDVDDVRHAVEHAGWGFGYVDGWTGADTKPAFLAAVGEALDFPDHYGQNFDALADCLHDIGAGRDGVCCCGTAGARSPARDEKAFSIALSVLGSRVNAERGVPFAVLLRARPRSPSCPASTERLDSSRRLRPSAGWPRRPARAARRGRASSTSALEGLDRERRPARR